MKNWYKCDCTIQKYETHMICLACIMYSRKSVSSCPSANLLQNIDFEKFKPVMLAALRSLLPKQWSTKHETAWEWLWLTVARNLNDPWQTVKGNNFCCSVRLLWATPRKEDNHSQFMYIYELLCNSICRSEIISWNIWNQGIDHEGSGIQTVQCEAFLLLVGGPTQSIPTPGFADERIYHIYALPMLLTPIDVRDFVNPFIKYTQTCIRTKHAQRSRCQSQELVLQAPTIQKLQDRPQNQ